MNSKDKPKRGASGSFVRETRPRAEQAGAKPGHKPKGKFGEKPGAKFEAAKGPARHGSSGPSEARFAKAGAAKFRPKRPDDRKPDARRPDEMRVETPARRPAAFAAAAGEGGKPERISKILARAGVASRRDVERMIMEGRVKLNGQLLDTPVVNATLNDKIEVDGMPIRGPERTRLWLYHKPAGLVTTNSDPEGRSTVFDNLPEELPRVLSIGRLDINTEGLLLLTNDGGLSRVLELPTTGWLRRYRVRAHGEIDQEALDKLKDGIAVDGVLYGSIEATLDRTQGRNVWMTIGLREGKNREIKNVLGALGLEVNRLIRISYGPFQLGDLPEGHVVEVRGRTLRDQLGPRLIEDSKANFDAPLYADHNAGEDKPDAAAQSERTAKSERAAKSEMSGRPEKSGRPRATEKDGRRDDRGGPRKQGWAAAPKGGKSFDRDAGGEKPKKRPPAGTSRTANVWMAPGARPTADGKPHRSARAEAENFFKKPVPENDRRVVVKRADDDRDWIRADEPERSPRDGEGGRFDRKRSFGDRPERGDRSSEDRPRGDRKPREAGERSGRPAFGDKSRGDKPRGDWPRGDKPREGKAGSGGKSFGGKSFGNRPGGGKSAGRPSNDRPSGARPSGGRPSGGRPGKLRG